MTADKQDRWRAFDRASMRLRWQNNFMSSSCTKAFHLWLEQPAQIGASKAEAEYAAFFAGWEAAQELGAA